MYTDRCRELSFLGCSNTDNNLAISLASRLIQVSQANGQVKFEPCIIAMIWKNVDVVVKLVTHKIMLLVSY